MLVVARLHAYPYLHNAGAEWAAHELLKALVRRGHDVQVWMSTHTGQRKPYDVDGVKVIPAAAGQDFAVAVKRAGVVLSHLEGVRPAAAHARGWGKPFVVLCHNTFEPTWRALCSGTTALAVYNSEWMQATAREWMKAHPRVARPAREIVVRPPVYAGDYRTTPGDAITLINLYGPKGGTLFWELAERMPDREFLGVVGAYGDQVRRDLPNVEVLDHVPGCEMAERVYSRTRILLMPSIYESWGRTGVEAMASGIPVLAHRTPGLEESLGDAGIFADRDDPDAWVDALRSLEDEAAWQDASTRALKRSAELDPAADLAAWCEAIEGLKR